jgi:succinate dehydrogenase / fumarate reductase iron-sulfur subunit/fumarate reductase iron-sulfur subunit
MSPHPIERQQPLPSVEDAAGKDTGQVRVTVRRSDPGAPSQFVVDRFSPMMVLDLLLAIQRAHDASLGFRFSCRVAMCGTCTMRMDGRTILACQTPLEPDRDEVRLEPMAGLPVVRDLIVDMTPFWREWARITPYLVPVEGLDEPARVRPDSAERQQIDPSLDCITCGACYSSCGIADERRDFLGPAALNRAMVLIADSRDAAGEERLEAVSGSDGVDRCHYIYGCSAVCPKDLDPAGSIRALRRMRLSEEDR